MKFVTYSRDGTESYGAVVGNGVVGHGPGPQTIASAAMLAVNSCLVQAQRARFGGAEERVLPEDCNLMAEPWALADDGIYYIRAFPRELFYFDLASGVSRSLGEIFATRYGSIALDPRGEKLIAQFNEWVGADIYTAQWPMR